MAKSKRIKSNRLGEKTSRLNLAVMKATVHLKEWGITFNDRPKRKREQNEQQNKKREEEMIQPESSPVVQIEVKEPKEQQNLASKAVEISDEDIGNIPEIHTDFSNSYGLDLFEEDDSSHPFPQPLKARMEYGTVFSVIRFVSPDNQHKFALVYNNDRPWPSFPGGGCEYMENEIAAAQRENFEETGIQTEENQLELFGQIQKSNGYLIALLTVDVPIEKKEEIRPGIEQMSAWAVSPAFLDELAKRNKIMPDHAKTWQYYKTCFPERI